MNIFEVESLYYQAKKEPGIDALEKMAEAYECIPSLIEALRTVKKDTQCDCGGKYESSLTKKDKVIEEAVLLLEQLLVLPAVKYLSITPQVYSFLQTAKEALPRKDTRSSGFRQR